MVEYVICWPPPPPPPPWVLVLCPYSSVVLQSLSPPPWPHVRPLRNLFQPPLSPESLQLSSSPPSSPPPVPHVARAEPVRKVRVTRESFMMNMS